MKFLSIAMVALAAQSSFALECKYDKTPVDGAAVSIQITQNPDKTYKISLSERSAMTPKATTAVYDQVSCRVSPKFPLLMSCRAPMPASTGVNGSFSIETRLSYKDYFGETLTVAVDPDDTWAAVGLTPSLKEISAPVEVCKY